MGCRIMDSIDLAQDKGQWSAVVNMVMNLRVPYNFGKFLSSYATGDLRGTWLRGGSHSSNLRSLQWVIFIWLGGKHSGSTRFQSEVMHKSTGIDENDSLLWRLCGAENLLRGLHYLKSNETVKGGLLVSWMCVKHSHLKIKKTSKLSKLLTKQRSFLVAEFMELFGRLVGTHLIISYFGPELNYFYEHFTSIIRV
jgi:hypothetical protein